MNRTWGAPIWARLDRLPSCVRGSRQMRARAAFNRNLHAALPAHVLKAGREGMESCHEHHRDPPSPDFPRARRRHRSKRPSASPAAQPRFRARRDRVRRRRANAPAWLVLKGSIDVVRRDGLNRETPITTHRVGQFSGEMSQLAGRGSLASGRAGPDGCTALPFDAAHLRALMVGSAEVGEIIMRAFILRRVGLIEEGGAGSVLIGFRARADLVAAAELSPPQRLSAHGARRRRRRGRPRAWSSVSACSRTTCR